MANQFININWLKKPLIYLVVNLTVYQKDILKNLNSELTIPHFRTDKFKPDSLNVANSVAIFLSELSKT